MKQTKKPSTINNHLRYFKTLLRYGHENGMMDEVKIKMNEADGEYHRDGESCLNLPKTSMWSIVTG